jgi:hypothetical protein
VVGRDIEEEQALALLFDQVSATWSLEGKVGEAHMKQQSRERQTLLDLLREYPSGLTLSEVAELVGKNPYTVRNILKRMVYQQTIRCIKGVYIVPSGEQEREPQRTADNHANHANHANQHTLFPEKESLILNHENQRADLRG